MKLFIIDFIIKQKNSKRKVLIDEIVAAENKDVAVRNGLWKSIYLNDETFVGWGDRPLEELREAEKEATEEKKETGEFYFTFSGAREVETIDGVKITYEFPDNSFKEVVKTQPSKKYVRFEK